MTPIQIPPMAGAGHGAWSFVLQLAAKPQAPPWVLVGGLMVQLHALEHGFTSVRPTGDADVLVDVLTVPRGISEMCDLLAEMGLTFEGANAHGVGHRFSRETDHGRVQVDVLAPDRLGSRTSLVTVPPARTVQIPAGRRIFKDSESVAVSYGTQQANVRRPTLITAIIGKTKAWQVDKASPTRDRHLEDAAVLLSLVADPIALAETFDRKQRATMRALAALLPTTHPAWFPLADKASDGIATLSFLSESN